MGTKDLFKKSVIFVTLSSFLVWNYAVATPQGGAVAQGSAVISNPSSTQTVINQSSQNAVINWNSFNTASNQSVQFIQPSSSAVALNRITSGLPTTFAGQLTANGQVWILNPAGVLFTKTSKIDVSGLVATTLNIQDSDFMAGNYNLSQSPNYPQGKVINNGNITIENDGLVALVAPTVVNRGTITANMGTVVLASGTVATLDPYGDNLIEFAPNNYAVNGSITNKGTITANGGRVLMTANSINNVIKDVVNDGGMIEAANAVQSSNGVIILGGNSGTTNITGTINSNRITIKGNNTVISGNLTTPAGGTIETSGNTVSIDPAAVINPGQGGLWYMDPLTIDLSSYGNTIQNLLSAGSNVTIYTGTNTSIPGAGTITDDVALSWSTPAILTLAAYGNIDITQPINIVSGGLILRPDVTGTNPSIVTFSGSGHINTNTFGTLKLFYDPPSGYASPIDYSSFISGNSQLGVDVEYMMINNQTDFNTLMALAVTTPAVASYDYNLNTNVTYSGSNPMFNNFSGVFDGHNYVTGANSTITAGTISGAFGLPGEQGTFAGDVSGILQNINISALVVTNVSSAASFVGGVAGLVGSAGSGAQLNNVNFSGSITTSSAAFTGGIAGATLDSILNNDTYVSGALNATNGSSVGGIAGASNNSIYSQVIVDSGATLGATNAANFGGIVGTVVGNTGPTIITNSYTQNPAVAIAAPGTANGGIVGFLNSGSSLVLDNLYAGDANVSVAVGGTFDFIIGTNANPGGGSNNISVYALYYTLPSGCGSFTCTDSLSAQPTAGNPYSPVAPIYPAIPTTNLGEGMLSSASSQTVNISADNTLIASPTSDATGTYVFTYDPNLDPGFFTASTSGTVTGLTLNKFATQSSDPLAGLNITNNTLTVISELTNPVSNSDLATLSFPAFYSVSGNDLTLASGINFLTTATTPYTLDGNITVPSGNITFNAPATSSISPVLTSGGTVTLDSVTDSGVFTVNAVGDIVVNGVLTSTASPGTPSVVFDADGNITFNAPVASAISPELTSGGTVTLDGVTESGVFTVNAADDIVLNGVVAATAPSGTQSVIFNANSFMNNVGSTAINPGAGNSFLIYLSTPVGSTFNGLNSGNQAIWDQTITTLPPASAPAGSRYIFAFQPSPVTITTTSAVKDYGTDLTNSVGTQYTATGFVDASLYGNVFTQDTVSNSFINYAPTSLGAAPSASVAGSPYPVTVPSNIMPITGYPMPIIHDFGTITVLSDTLSDEIYSEIPPIVYQQYNFAWLNLNLCSLDGCEDTIIDVDLVEVAFVTEADGTVTAVDDNGSSRFLEEGDTVFAGETIITGPGSHICIRLPYSTKKCFGPNERYKVS